MSVAETRLPEIYRKFLKSHADWQIQHLAIPERTWKLASAGNNNPLSLDTIWNLDGNKVTFVDQTQHWASIVDEHGFETSMGMKLPQFASCLSIAEDNGDLLVTDPEDHFAVYLFTRDGLTLEKMSASIEEFLEGVEPTNSPEPTVDQLPAGDDGLIGVWKNEDLSLGEERVTLQRDGKVSKSYDDGSNVVGVWRLEKQWLILHVGEPNSLPQEERYEIKWLSPNRIRLTDHENDFFECWIRQQA